MTGACEATHAEPCSPGTQSVVLISVSFGIRDLRVPFAGAVPPRERLIGSVSKSGPRGDDGTQATTHFTEASLRKSISFASEGLLKVKRSAGSCFQVPIQKVFDGGWMVGQGLIVYQLQLAKSW